MNTSCKMRISFKYGINTRFVCLTKPFTTQTQVILKSVIVIFNGLKKEKLLKIKLIHIYYPVVTYL